MSPIIAIVVASCAFCAVAIALYANGLPGPARVAPAAGAQGPGVDSRLHQQEIARIAWWGFAARLLLGAILLATGWSQAVAPDSSFYSDFGASIAEAWSVGTRTHLNPFNTGQGRFATFNAVFYYVVGPVPILLVIMAAAGGAWTVRLTARIAGDLSGPAAAVRTAWLVALFPSLVLWGSLDMRDPFLVLAVAGAAHETLLLRRGFTLSRLLRTAFFLLIMVLFREYLFAMVSAGIAIGLVLGSGGRKGGRIVGTVLVVAAAFFVVQRMGIRGVALDELGFDQAQHVRHGLTSSAKSAYLTNYDISTTEGLAVFLPLGLAYFLFAPFPWAARGGMQLITVPEMLLWYFLFPHVIRGIRLLWRSQRSGMWVLVSMAVTITVTYALISGNVGTAYRHRAQVLPLLLVLVGIGWTRAAARRSAAAGAPRTGTLPGRQRAVMVPPS